MTSYTNLMTQDPATQTTTFTTPLRHVLGEIMFVLVTVPVILVVGLVASGFCGYLASSAIPENFPLASSVSLICTFVFVFISFFCTLVWLWAKRRLKFTLRIGNETLVYGKWPFRESIRVTDAETIVEHKAGISCTRGANRVVITGSGKNWVCLFEHASRDCITALRGVCLNAVFVGVEGKEHLPQKAPSQSAAIRNLIRVRWARAFAALLVAIPSLAGSVLFLSMVLARVKNGVALASAFDGLPLMYLLEPFIGLSALSIAVHQWRRALSLSNRVKAHTTLSVQELVLEDAVARAEARHGTLHTGFGGRRNRWGERNG